MWQQKKQLLEADYESKSPMNAAALVVLQRIASMWTAGVYPK